MTKTFGTHRRPVTIVVLALALAGVIAILFAMEGLDQRRAASPLQSRRRHR